MNHIPINGSLGVMQSHPSTECVLANTNPHQQCRGARPQNGNCYLMQKNEVRLLMLLIKQVEAAQT